jgi:hypothetical protein
LAGTAQIGRMQGFIKDWREAALHHRWCSTHRSRNGNEPMSDHCGLDGDPMTRRTRTALVGFAASVLALLGPGNLPAYADPATPGSSATGPAPAAPVCAASAPKAGDEFVHCVSVSAGLDAVPAVGGTATLTATVRASIALSSTRVHIDLPAQLAWAQVPTGFTTSTTTSPRPERPGQISVAELTRSFAAGETLTVQGTVKAVSAGAGQIEVTATQTIKNGQGNGTVVYIRVPEKAGAAPAVIAPTGIPAAVRGKPTSVGERPSWLTPRSVRTAAVSGAAAASAACDTWATGSWNYADQDGVFHPSMNVTVDIVDASNGVLAEGGTDSSGAYKLCFNSTRGRNIFAMFTTANALWKVASAGAPYVWSTESVLNPAAGSTVDFGWRTTADASFQRGLHAFDEVNDAYLFLPHSANGCWDPNDTTCRQVNINWTPTSTDGPMYTLSDNVVHLTGDAPNTADIVIHETTHAILDDINNDAVLGITKCDPHWVTSATSGGCAWWEGFAEWLPLMILHDTVLRDPSWTVDLENATWNTSGWNGTGDTVEGRVAAALIDLADSTNEAYWDRTSEGFNNIWYTVTHHVIKNFAQFWARRLQDGFDVNAPGALATLYQNTIDYKFRDPLTTATPLLRPTPLPHNFSFRTTSNYWAVVGIRPTVDVDYDLQVYDDFDQSTPLSGSFAGKGTIDFVAIDSNRRTVGDDYYPRAYVYAGSGGYLVELSQPNEVLFANSLLVVTMRTSNIVLVRDTFLDAGTPVTFTVTPFNSGQDPELFLMCSDASTPASFVQGRASAIASSTGQPPGQPESFTFTPTVSQWYGVVVTNKAGSGNLSLLRT